MLEDFCAIPIRKKQQYNDCSEWSLVQVRVALLCFSSSTIQGVVFFCFFFNFLQPWASCWLHLLHPFTLYYTASASKNTTQQHSEATFPGLQTGRSKVNSWHHRCLSITPRCDYTPTDCCQDCFHIAALSHPSAAPHCRSLHRQGPRKVNIKKKCLA